MRRWRPDMVTRFAREEFFADRFDYRPGQHVLAVGPTQRSGKTQLLFTALQSVMPTESAITAFCMKPRDRTAAAWTEALGFQEIPAWPPRRRPLQQAPPGVTLWPRHTFDPAIDDEHIGDEFRKGMLAGYKNGNTILFLDEIYGILAELGLVKELNAILTRGQGMGCGAWMATQKPSGTQQAGMPGFVFNSPTHMFLAPDNVAANRKRYGELAGDFDPAEVEDITLHQLRAFEFLYLHAAGHMCIVGA
jgi:energy-coupling factor transporter ATP-binding protein EcfA2